MVLLLYKNIHDQDTSLTTAAANPPSRHAHSGFDCLCTRHHRSTTNHQGHTNERTKNNAIVVNAKYHNMYDMTPKDRTATAFKSTSNIFIHCCTAVNISHTSMYNQHLDVLLKKMYITAVV